MPTPSKGPPVPGRCPGEDTRKTFRSGLADPIPARAVSRALGLPPLTEGACAGLLDQAAGQQVERDRAAEHCPAPEELIK